MRVTSYQIDSNDIPFRHSALATCLQWEVVAGPGISLDFLYLRRDVLVDLADWLVVIGAQSHELRPYVVIAPPFAARGEPVIQTHTPIPSRVERAGLAEVSD
jgi:hypothetical protein